MSALRHHSRHLSRGAVGQDSTDCPKNLKYRVDPMLLPNLGYLRSRTKTHGSDLKRFASFVRLFNGLQGNSPVLDMES